METREWNHVDSKFPEISIQLAGEAETRGHARHGG